MTEATVIPFMEGDSDKKPNILERLMRRVQSDDVTPQLLNAHDAFVKTTYGKAKSDVELINEWRTNVVKQIDTAMRCEAMNQTAYNTLVVVPEDMMQYSQKLFQPFADGGYLIHQLKQHIPSFPKENVFLISWEKR